MRNTANIEWRAARLVSLIACLSTITASALTTDNPYQIITARNAFHLQAPVVTPIEDPPKPALPLLSVTLTGITTVGFWKRVFLEIRDPARPNARTEFLTLTEGERAGDIEVLTGGIDAQAGRVRLKIRGAETVLTFPKPSLSADVAPTPAPPIILGSFSTGNSKLFEIVKATPPPQSAQRDLTHEEAVLLMEAYRRHTEDDVAAGRLPPLPDPLAGTGLREEDAAGTAPLRRSPRR